MTGRRIMTRAVARNRRRLSAGIGLTSLHQVCESLVPILIGVIVDQAIGPGDAGALVVWLAALAALFTALTLAYRFGARQLMLAIADEAHLLRAEVAAKIMHPRGIRTDRRAGDLLTVATTDTDNTSYLLDYVPRIAGAVTATAVSAVALLVIDVRLGLAVLAGTPLVLLALQVAAPVITRRVTEQQNLAGEATSLAADLVGGVRPLRGIGAEHAAAARYDEVSRRSLRAALRAARTQGWYLSASTAGGALLAGGVAILAGWFALNGRITVGELITVIGLAQFLMEPVGLLTLMPSRLAEARASACRVGAVLDAPALLPEGAETLDGTRPELELRALRYGTLDGVDLRVRPGEFVGVVAHRPADGEALVTILSGRVAPEEYEGEVLLGGALLPRLDPADARRTMLVEPHLTDLFTGTIEENVTAGGPLDAQALAASAADQVVRAHPGGLAHVVAERGAGLSGGQRQRLALARALTARPPILVMRDPTTAVDAMTEHEIARGLRALRHPGPGAFTTVIVTSSPSLLALTDRVVVLDGGRVAAEGTHAELAVTDDDYNRMVLR
ncbi:ABC transporter ATP-binding protein [Nonomuraea terrae]|uniref:ABC transporter ATP-binding protein n=1 Tax=Nonomuraea terrae TaxID=2530383 RepID=A0A4R4YR86_9ACTN|nr:ABC transporter ATP-binding protein [Nonomuraea terrae]TDD46679.1 ABC transporter ATP-binding protein [Nonomuraea terrae]